MSDVPHGELLRRLQIMRGLGHSTDGALAGAVREGYLTFGEADALATDIARRPTSRSADAWLTRHAPFRA